MCLNDRLYRIDVKEIQMQRRKDIVHDGRRNRATQPAKPRHRHIKDSARIHHISNCGQVRNRIENVFNGRNTDDDVKLLFLKL